MAKKEDFKVGDTVRLKSGGPDMTVQTVPSGSVKAYRCQWFSGKKLEGGHFPFESLEEAKQEKK